MKLNLNRAYRLATTSALYLVLVTLLACGKEAEIKSRRVIRNQDPMESAMEARIAKHFVECEPGLACPGGLAKVVVVDRDRLRSCTGFLVNSITLATSASCLPAGLRLSGDENRCQKDLHVFFARSGFSEARRVRCQRTLLASPLVGADPILWRNDIAYFELAEPVYRRSFQLNREGLPDRGFFTMWKVDADNDEAGIIRKQDCQVIVNSYVNPLATSEFSPSTVLAGCSFTAANTGAILLGPQGRWRGMVSRAVDRKLTDFITNTGLLVEPLAPLLHASNGACLPSVLESDPVKESECLKDLDYGRVDRRRSEMLELGGAFGESLKQIAAEVSAQQPFLRFGASLDAQSDGRMKVKVEPVCFKPVRAWIDQVGRGTKRYTGSVNIKDWTLSYGFDRAARLINRMSEGEAQKFFVQFSPRAVWNQRAASVFMWPSGVSSTVYRDIGECPAGTATAEADATTSLRDSLFFSATH